METDFLDAGAEAEAASRQRDRQQVRRQVRINRRLRAMLAGVAALSVAAAGSAPRRPVHDSTGTRANRWPPSPARPA